MYKLLFLPHAANVLASQLEDTQAKFVFCTPGNQSRIHEALTKAGRLDKTQVIVVKVDNKPHIEIHFDGFTPFEDFLASGDPKSREYRDQAAFDRNDTAVILWSSGTTGRPKGIQHGFGYFLSLYARQDIDWIQGASLTTTCFFHVSGLFGGLVGLKQPGTGHFFTTDDLTDSEHGTYLMLNYLIT